MDESTGEIRKGLTAARLETIFQTNMQSAYMAGRYEEMLDQVDERPFWQYVAVLDSKTRPAHRTMHGRIFRYDDPGWRYFYPPNGYKCRCRVRNLSRRDMQRKKLIAETTEGQLRQIRVTLRDGSTTTVARYSPSSVPGTSFQPDVGFSNNPGLLGWQPKLEPMDVQLSRRYVDTAIQGPAFERFVQGKDSGVFPVAVLRPQDQARLAAETSVAYLSSQTVTKQLARHSEIGVDDYRRIPDIVDQGEAYQQADNRLVFLFEGDLVWRLALKATTKRTELYVLSLFRTTRSAAEKEVRERLKKI